MPLLDAAGLGISFRTERGPLNVVNDLTFSIDEGSVFGLAGESGCGKSLTALALMRILPDNAVSSGTALFKGRDLFGLNEAEMRSLRGMELSMIFQEPMTSLNPVLTIGYQIREVLETHLGLSKKDAIAGSIELLKAVKIPSPEIRHREYPHQMSGGMRQRVMIAMAIACNPSLLIADEPTTALDVTIETQILGLIQDLREERNMAVLLITHDLGVIAENADRVAIMYAGRIVEMSEVRQVLETPRHPYTMGLLDSLPKQKGVRLTPIKGTVPRPEELPPGCKFSDRCGHAIDECTTGAEPALVEAAPGHLARCIRTKEIRWESST